MPTSKKVFKTCPRCRYEWKTREQFISDSSITLIGFQADFDNFAENLYLFNHDTRNKHCSTTFSVHVTKFLDLYRGPAYTELKKGTEECSGRCLKVNDLEQCAARCKNAIAREIMRNLVGMMQYPRP